jgi:flavin reductase (DIM6/NTAB) family NADH-FMN oxidoreductase RutF
MTDPAEALAHLPMAVVVVGAAADGARSCSTGTATYASYEPPLVVTPLAAGSRTGELARASGEFSLSVLAADQAEVAVRAAGPTSADKFADQEIAVEPPPAGRVAPGVAGSVVTLWCEIESAADAGRYLLVVGRVRDAVAGGGEPLLRFGRRYRALGEPVPVEREAPYPL